MKIKMKIWRQPGDFVQTLGTLPAVANKGSKAFRPLGCQQGGTADWAVRAMGRRYILGRHGLCSRTGGM